MSIAELVEEKEYGINLPPKSTSLATFVRKKLRVIFVLDTSGSMSGPRMTSLNYGMGEMKAILLKLLHGRLAGYDLELLVISFSSGATIKQSWVSPENWTYSPLKASGATDYRAAYDLVNRQLTSTDDESPIATVIILASDGRPNQSPNAAFKQCMLNPLFKHAQRAAVAVGEADRSTLVKFVSADQKVYDISNPDEVGDAITAATLASIGAAVSPATGGAPDSPFNGSSSPKSRAPSMKSLIHSSLTSAEMQALRDAGVDPSELV